MVFKVKYLRNELRFVMVSCYIQGVLMVTNVTMISDYFRLRIYRHLQVTSINIDFFITFSQEKESQHLAKNERYVPNGFLLKMA